MTRADAFADIFRRSIALVRFAQFTEWRPPSPITVTIEDDGTAWSMRVDGRVFSGRHEYSPGEGATERV